MAKRKNTKPETTPAAPGSEVIEKFRNRNKRVVRVKASSLEVHPRNFRMHGDYQRSALFNVLNRLGIVGSLLAWEPEPGRLQIFDGHLRREELGDDLVDVTVTDLNELEVLEILAVYDKLSALATPDIDLLSDIVNDLREREVPLDTMGWTDIDLDAILNSKVTVTVTDPEDPETGRSSGVVEKKCQILIDFGEDETKQAEWLTKLTGEGLDCRSLIS